jgi:hypothetical protein
VSCIAAATVELQVAEQSHYQRRTDFFVEEYPVTDLRLKTAKIFQKQAKKWPVFHLSGIRILTGVTWPESHAASRACRRENQRCGCIVVR